MRNHKTHTHSVRKQNTPDYATYPSEEVSVNNEKKKEWQRAAEKGREDEKKKKTKPPTKHTHTAAERVCVRVCLYVESRDRKKRNNKQGDDTNNRVCV